MQSLLESKERHVAQLVAQLAHARAEALEAHSKAQAFREALEVAQLLRNVSGGPQPTTASYHYVAATSPNGGRKPGHGGSLLAGCGSRAGGSGWGLW